MRIAGFNCAGEIGAVGGKNFLHGFMASVALLAEAWTQPVDGLSNGRKTPRRVS